MKVISIEAKSNGKNLGGKKECTDYFVLVGFKNGEFQELVTARCYMSYNSDGASPVYASVWVNGYRNNKQKEYISASGQGRASGYGYHKTSQAIQDALTDAGFTLSEDIGGRGTSCIKSALMAIGDYFGYKKLHIVRG